MVEQIVQGRIIHSKGNLNMYPPLSKPLTIVDEITEDLIFKFYYRSLAEGQDKGHRGAGAMCVKGVCPGTHLESPLPCWIGSHPTLQNFALPWQPAGAAPLSPSPTQPLALSIYKLHQPTPGHWAAENYTQGALLERSTWRLKILILYPEELGKINWVREEKNRVWSSSSFVTDCKGVAVAAHGSFIAPQLAPLKHVSHPLHICMLTSTLHVPLQIDFGKCKIALVAFVLLPNYCLPLKPAAHTYCNSFGNN